MTTTDRILIHPRAVWPRMWLVSVLAVCVSVSAQGQAQRGPLTLEEVTTLLTAEVAMATIEDGMREFSLDFRLTAAIEASLRSAGATESFLQSLRALPALVTVTSDPPGATVFINGQQRGQTPIETLLPPSAIRVSVTLDGYLTAEEMLTLAPGVAETMHLVLVVEPRPEPVAPTLEVLTQPPGATVSVDGQQRGETPLSLTLNPGTHELAITMDDYLENRQSVDLEAGETETLSVILTSAEALQPVVENGEGGGSRLKWTLVGFGIAGAGIAADAAWMASQADEVAGPPVVFEISARISSGGACLDCGRFLFRVGQAGEFDVTLQTNTSPALLLRLQPEGSCEVGGLAPGLRSDRSCSARDSVFAGQQIAVVVSKLTRSAGPVEFQVHIHVPSGTRLLDQIVSLGEILSSTGPHPGH